LSKETPGVRYAEQERETEETRVRVVVDLDGARRATVDTGIGFFDHMLTQFAFHGGFDLGVSAEGDLHVDDHHTVEDVGICLGGAIRQALGDAEGINRFGSEHAPTDDALVRVVADVSGRPFLEYGLEFDVERIGGLSTENIAEFFRAVVNHSGITLHVHKLAGTNNHHVCEAAFKAFGRALRKAVTRVDSHGAPSTKGVID
jgi:imidazoleglycerol-phosphate dehydratase